MYAIRSGDSSGGPVDILGALRTLSRVVKDAARVETPPLRAYDARCGYLAKYNLPLSKARASVVGVPQSSDPKPPVRPSAPEPMPTRPRLTDRVRGDDACPTYRDRSPQHGRASKGSKRKSLPSESAHPADSLVYKKVRGARLTAWLAGKDE